MSSERPASTHLESILEAFVTRSAGGVAAAICVVYVISIAQLTSLPMQDYPNHVARAAIMQDLLFHHGIRFGQFFELHLAPVPYVLPDLLLAGALELFGPVLAAALFTSITVLSLPCALLLYAHVHRLAPRPRVFLFLVGLYLSTDWFFLMGFMAFRLSLALVIVSLALAELLRRRWSTATFVAHVTVVIIGFLTHLTAPVFLGWALAVSALVRLRLRTTSVRRELLLIAPLIVLFGWYFGLSGMLSKGGEPLDYNWAGTGFGTPLGRKLRDLSTEFLDFNWHLAVPTFAVFLVCLLWPLRGVRSIKALKKPDVIEPLALAVAFGVLYFILPGEYRDAQFVDVRTLPMISLFLVLALLNAAPREPGEQGYGSLSALGLAGLLAISNLAYMMIPLESSNAFVKRYRTVVAAIPAGAYVLPVHTETQQQHLLHISAHAVLDRFAATPYLFSAENGDPMSYFHYKQHPYAPDNQWYRAELHGGRHAAGAAIDWGRVGCAYDFLLVTMPYDARFIRTPTVKVASNEEATLLAVDKSGCPAAGARGPR